MDEPGLSDAGDAEHREELARTIASRLARRRRGAACARAHGRPSARRAAAPERHRTGPGAATAVRLLRAHRSSKQAPSTFVEADLSRACSPAELRRRQQRLADRSPVQGGIDGAHDLTRADPDANIELQPLLGVELRGEGRESLSHRNRRTYAPDCVVLVRDREPEERGQAVSGDRLDDTAVLLDGDVDQREGATCDAP